MESLANLLQPFADIVKPILEFCVWCFPFKVCRLHDGESAVITTFGKVYNWRNAEKGPGVWFYFMFEEVISVQAKGGYIDLDPQSIMTKDKKLIIINSALIYDIKSVKASILETEDIELALSGLLMNKIREHARNKNLDEIVDSEKLTRDLINSLLNKSKKMGVKIIEVMITDLRPHEVIYACDTVEKIYNDYKDKDKQ